MDDRVDHPISLYAATKKANELMAHAYSHLFNVGNSDSVGLMDFIGIIEEEPGREAQKEMVPLQPGDVPETTADIERSRECLGFNPHTPLREGIRAFLAWYRDYYGYK